MAERLWDKGGELDTLVHRFTVGEDYLLDRELVQYDAIASAAHARGLAEAGLLSAAQCEALCTALADVQAQALKGEFQISPEQEDCHTAIEHYLVARCGEDGKRIHLGRSRNDQVITALRLYMRAQANVLGQAVLGLAEALLALARRGDGLLMPGWTHLRKAMPSTGGAWAYAFAEGLAEELEALAGVEQRLDRCPLGSAAGFGAPVPLERGYVAGLLGFSRVQESTIDVQNSRGRHELALAGWLCSVALSVEKLCWDIQIFSLDELGYVSLPDAFTTGSSIMPNKRNPDVIELARARCRELRGLRGTIEEIASGLPYSYHRDFQLLKAPLFRLCRLGSELLHVMTRVVEGLSFNPERMAAGCDASIYAAQRATQLAAAGLPFRDAYKQAAGELAGGRLEVVSTYVDAYVGAPGKLPLDALAHQLAAEGSKAKLRLAQAAACEARLFAPPSPLN